MVSADSADSSDCADYSNVQTAVNVGRIRELLGVECQMLHGRYRPRGGGAGSPMPARGFHPSARVPLACRQCITQNTGDTPVAPPSPIRMGIACNVSAGARLRLRDVELDRFLQAHAEIDLGLISQIATGG